MANPKRYSMDNTRCGCGKKSDFKFTVLVYPLVRASKVRKMSSSYPCGVCATCLGILASGTGLRNVKTTLDRAANGVTEAASKAIFKLEQKDVLATGNGS